MAQPLSYVHQSQWVNEGSIWRPPDPIILRDEAGVPISSTAMTTIRLTLYDLSHPERLVLGNTHQVDIKNTRSCSISSVGVFIFTLLPQDTVIINDASTYELRRALIHYTWAAGVKSDSLEITCVVRNLHYHTGSTISGVFITEEATVVLV